MRLKSSARLQACEAGEPLVDEVAEVAELVAAVAQTFGEVDAPAGRELHHRSGPHRALKVHVQVHLGQLEQIPGMVTGGYSSRDHAGTWLRRSTAMVRTLVLAVFGSSPSADSAARRGVPRHVGHQQGRPPMPSRPRHGDLNRIGRTDRECRDGHYGVVRAQHLDGGQTALSVHGGEDASRRMVRSCLRAGWRRGVVTPTTAFTLHAHRDRTQDRAAGRVDETECRTCR